MPYPHCCCVWLAKMVDGEIMGIVGVPGGGQALKALDWKFIFLYWLKATVWSSRDTEEAPRGTKLFLKSKSGLQIQCWVAQPTVLHIGNTSSYNSVKCIYLDYSKQRCLCYISIFIKEMCCFFFWVFLPPNAQKSLTAAAVKSILFHCSSTESCLMLDWGSFHPWVHAMGIWSKVRLSFSGLSVAGGVSHLYGDFFLSRLKMCTRHQHCPHLSGCVFRRFF